MTKYLSFLTYHGIKLKQKKVCKSWVYCLIECGLIPALSYPHVLTYNTRCAVILAQCCIITSVLTSLLEFVVGFFNLSGTPCLRDSHKFAVTSACVNVGTCTVAQKSNYHCVRNVDSLKRCTPAFLHTD